MDQIRKGAELLRHGKVIGFPTETLYGIGANALDEDAVRKVFALKGRPQEKALLVLVSDERMLQQVVKEIPHEARRLMDAFWPGPLTILFEKSPSLPAAVSSLPTVGVRIPGNQVTVELIRQAGVPIVAPSANPAGEEAPTNVQQVRDYFPDIFVLDGGESEHKIPSTIIALFPRPKIIRLGAIGVEEIRRVIPEIE
jgi:L-threonylcarbamoyladenylate synthase